MSLYHYWLNVEHIIYKLDSKPPNHHKIKLDCLCYLNQLNVFLNQEGSPPWFIPE